MVEKTEKSAFLESSNDTTKGSILSEGMIFLSNLKKKVPNHFSWAENLNKFTVMGGKFKFKFSAQESDLALFVWGFNKCIIPSEKKLPLTKMWKIQLRKLLKEAAKSVW